MTQAATIPRGLLFGQDFSGAKLPAATAPTDAWTASITSWSVGYEELIRPLYFGPGTSFGGLVYWYTSSALFAHAMEALPVPRHEGPNETIVALRTIERAFGDSASDLAKMLRVSRPMVYYYRQGMQPSPENFRRIKLVASLADYVSTEGGTTLGTVLKSPQPEGKSLLELLSEENPDVSVIRRILLRTSADLQKRQRLVAALGYATTHDRQDIMRERHASGKPIYVTDPDSPGKVIQIRPDKSRVRGRMVNRVFVPDEG